MSRRSNSIFKENHVFIEEEDNRSDKVVMFEEELDGIDIDSIGNLVNSVTNAIDDIEVSMIFLVVTFFRVGCK